MGLVSFSSPWGFVENGRDERRLLQSFRENLDALIFVARWVWLRELILSSPLTRYLLPTLDDKTGMGFLISQADIAVKEREHRMKVEGDSFSMETPDFLQ
jgi:hypothetical protein